MIINGKSYTHTVADIAMMFGYTEGYVRELVSKGAIPGFLRGRKYIFNIQDVQSAMEVYWEQSREHQKEVLKTARSAKADKRCTPQNTQEFDVDDNTGTAPEYEPDIDDGDDIIFGI